MLRLARPEWAESDRVALGLNVIQERVDSLLATAPG